MEPRYGRRITLAVILFLLLTGAQRWRDRVLESTRGDFLTQVESKPEIVSSSQPFEAVPIPTTKPTPRVALGTPRFVPEMVQLKRMGSVCSQNLWRDEDCELHLAFRVENAEAPFGGNPTSSNSRTRDNNLPWPSRPEMPRPLHWTLQSEAGAVLSTSIFGGSDWSSGWKVTPGNTPSPEQLKQPRFSFSCSTNFDLDRVPETRGVVTLGTRYTMPDGRALPIRVVVRPAWFTRAARTISLQSSQWLAPAGGDEGSVVLRLRATGAPLLLRDEPQGSQISWQAALMSGKKPGHELIPQRKLLHNWSPALENASGKFDSHQAKDAKVWKSYRRFYKDEIRPSTPNVAPQEVPVQKYLAGFWPKIWAQKPVQNGSFILVRYRFYGLRGFARKAVFKTEIGVPGDGFLKVSVPLPRRAT
ncbi:hypothetical protein B1R32_10672 [Abditibacterium utsteinense]|uniref:Uncharacterized protein n=1 Tax=Abditibacterium utsteinense TaxID=1960156 RepID=A0A2S8STV1_9BACT|nr:hypothetical protein [Abditibacterium utsteinense]PQV64227.1 hypothetical protein B1R32_10672 [Abditibacterium utsteinense]